MQSRELTLQSVPRLRTPEYFLCEGAEGPFSEGEPVDAQGQGLRILWGPAGDSVIITPDSEIFIERLESGTGDLQGRLRFGDWEREPLVWLSGKRLSGLPWEKKASSEPGCHAWSWCCYGNTLRGACSSCPIACQRC